MPELSSPLTSERLDSLKMKEMIKAFEQAATSPQNAPPDPARFGDSVALLALHDALCSEAKALMVRKNHDYTGKAKGNDALANFRHATKLNLCNLRQSVLIRLTDKVARLATSTNGELKVKDETVRDTVRDLINYSILFYFAHLEETENGSTPQTG